MGKNNNLGIALMIGFCLFMVISDSIAKFMSVDTNVFLVVWYRYLFHTLGFVCFALILRIVRSKEVLAIGNHKLQVARGVLLISSSLFFFYAISKMPLAESLALLYIFPIVSIILSSYFLKESTSKPQWLAIMIGFVGIVIVLQPQGEAFNGGAYYALIAGVFMAGYTVLTKRMSTNSHSVSSSIYTGGIGILMIPLIPGFNFADVFQSDLMWAAGMGLTAAVGHYFMFASLKRSPASVVTPFAYMEIVFASLASIVIFNDVLSLVTVLGISMICLCGIVLTRIEYKKTAQN